MSSYHDDVGAEVGTGPPTAGDDADPDAPWKPGFDWSESLTAHDAPVPAGSPGGGEEHPVRPPVANPWSRAGADGDSAGFDVRVRRADPRELAETSPWARNAPDTPVTRFDREAYRRTQGTQRRAVPSGARPAIDDLAKRAPRSAVPGDVAMVGLVVLVLATVAVVSSVVMLRRAIDDDSAAASCPVDRCAVQLPSAADELWAVTIDSGAVERVALASEWLALAVDGSIEVRSIHTGALAWRSAPLGDDLDVDVVVIDDLVVASTLWPGDGPSELVAFDVVSGAERWRYSAQPSGQVGMFDDWLFEFVDVRGDQRLQLIDAATGDRLAALISLALPDIVVPFVPDDDGGRVQLIDLDTGDPVGPRIDGFGLWALTAVGGSVVGIDQDATVILYDEAGRRVDEQQFTGEQRGGIADRVVLVGGVPGTDVGIVAGGTSMGFRIRDGAIEGLWEFDGRVSAPEMTDIGPVSLAETLDPTTGEIDVLLVNPLTGSTIVTLGSDGLTEQLPPTLGRDGYLVAPRDGAVSAFGFDGALRWSVDLPRFASYFADHGRLVMVERAAGESVIRAYG